MIVLTTWSPLTSRGKLKDLECLNFISACLFWPHPESPGGKHRSKREFVNTVLKSIIMCTVCAFSLLIIQRSLFILLKFAKEYHKNHSDTIYPASSYMHAHAHTQRSIPLQEGVHWEREIEQISKNIIGFSGREISKLAISWQVCDTQLMRLHDSQRLLL